MSAHENTASTLAALRTLFVNWHRGTLQLDPGQQAALPPGMVALAEALCTRQPSNPEFGALSCIVTGWAHYFGGNLPAATAQFQQAWEANEGWGTWAALGLGKVASDAGRWNLARAWLLHTLALARAEDDTQHLAAAAGALAEVFCRATPHNPSDGSLLRAAHELLELDAALLPVGSPFYWRVENYRAVCLGRLGASGRTAGESGQRAYREAQSRMWATHYGTESVDPISADYALASLYLLSLRALSHDMFLRAERRFTERAEKRSSTRAGMTEYPLGVIEGVRAFWAWRLGDGPLTVAQLDAAAAAFGPQAPLEKTWALALQAKIHREEPPVEAVTALRERHYPPPPAQPLVAAVDRVYAELQLPADDTPFEWLTASDLDQLWGGLAQIFV